MNIKDLYITKISQASDKYGNLLIEMMDKYSCINLQELTEKQVKEFYRERVEKIYECIKHI